jgi:hypothetical protein
MLALVASGFLTNLFGLEGPGATQLFVQPAPRSRVLLGKAMAGLVLFIPVNLILLAAGSGITAAIRSRPVAEMFPFFGRHALFHALFLVVLAAVGLFASILAPVRALPRGKRASSQRPAERSGCLVGLLRVGILAIALVIAAPIGALVFLPVVVGVPPLASAALQLAATAAAVTTLLVAAKLAGDLLVPREARIASILGQAPE